MTKSVNYKTAGSPYDICSIWQNLMMICIAKTRHTYISQNFLHILHTYTHTCAQAHTHLHTHVHTHARMHTHTHTTTRTHTRTHAHTHTHNHTHTHTYWRDNFLQLTKWSTMQRSIMQQQLEMYQWTHQQE